MRGNIELLGKNLTVSGSLVQHADVVRVLEDIFYFSAGQQVFDILREPGRDSAPLAEALPYFDRIRGCLFLL